MPIGQVTRGTTGTNRLRRIDRWIAQLPALRRAEHPLVVDLGYGASATTTLELHQRLARVRPDVEVVGVSAVDSPPLEDSPPVLASVVVPADTSAVPTVSSPQPARTSASAST